MLRLRAEAVEWRLVEGEVVALDLRDSVYLAINPSGAVLWPLLAEGTWPDALVDRLAEEYDLDRDAATRDVEAFLDSLRDRDLVEEVAATDG